MTNVPDQVDRDVVVIGGCGHVGLPLALAFGDGNEVRAPMAITVIGGLLVSTLLTLVVIPVVYTLLDRRSDAVYRERGVRKHMAVAADAAGLSPEAAV